MATSRPNATVSPATIGAAGDPTLSDTLKKASRAIHDLSTAIVNARLIVLFTDRELYGHALSAFYFIFQHLEQLTATALKSNAELAPFREVLPKLFRTAGFEQDLAYFLGPNWRSSLIEYAATKDYKSHLSSIAQSSPRLLLAHCYTQHLALASGGQIIKRMARKHMQLPAEHGTAAYDYGKDDPRLLKEQFVSILDSYGAKQQPEVWQQMVEEHTAAFGYNNRIMRTFPVGWIKIVVGVCKFLPPVALAAGAAAVLAAGVAAIAYITRR